MKIKKLFVFFCAVLAMGMTMCLTACGGKKSKIIEMGMYPQSYVTGAMKDNLNSLITSDPKKDSSWKAKHMYINYNLDVEMSDTQRGHKYLYKDFDYMGNKYRCMYEVSNYVDGPGYIPKYDASWYKFEPIKWKVIKEDKENNRMLLASVDAIDKVGNYDSQKTYDALFTDGIYANYEHSFIHGYLNSILFEFAFSKEEQDKILITQIDNSSNTMKVPEEDFVCADMEAKLFIPSYQELTNPDYGFIDDESRIVNATAYSHYKGSWDTSPDSYVTRSPEIYVPQGGSDTFIGFTHVSGKGAFYSDHSVNRLFYLTPWMWVSTAE